MRGQEKNWLSTNRFCLFPKKSLLQRKNKKKRPFLKLQFEVRMTLFNFVLNEFWLIGTAFYKGPGSISILFILIAYPHDSIFLLLNAILDSGLEYLESATWRVVLLRDQLWGWKSENQTSVCTSVTDFCRT